MKGLILRDRAVLQHGPVVSPQTHGPVGKMWSPEAGIVESNPSSASF